MPDDAPPLTENRIGEVTVVELMLPSLMEPPLLAQIQQRLEHLVTEMDRRRLILDFGRVEYISSQMIGVLISVNTKCNALKKGKLVLCGVGPRLEQLLKIMKLHKMLTIKPDQKVALKFLGEGM